MKRVSTRLGGKPSTPLAKSHFQGASRAERSEARCDGVPACWAVPFCPKIDPAPMGSGREGEYTVGGKPYTPLAKSMAKSHFQGVSRAERSAARCDGVPACWRSARSVRKSTPLLWVLVASCEFYDITHRNSEHSKKSRVLFHRREFRQG